jgi:hypothetical protein
MVIIKTRATEASIQAVSPLLIAAAAPATSAAATSSAFAFASASACCAGVSGGVGVVCA